MKGLSHLGGVRETGALAVCVLLASLLITGLARAECTPGQQQEADLAYKSAYEFLKPGGWEQAIPRLQSILEICPGHINSLSALARAYTELGRYEEAKVAYQRLIQVKGNTADAVDFAGLGNVLAKMKNYAEARTYYLRAQTKAPDDCGILFNLGMLHMANQFYRESVETLEKAFTQCDSYKDTILPQLTTACQKAADKERQIGNSERAKLYERKATKYATKAGGTAGYDQVAKLMDEGKHAEAIPVLLGILADDPTHAPSLLSLARCYSAVGKPEQATPYFEKYLELRPDDEGGATRELVQNYIETGQCQKAIELAQAAYKRLQPKGQSYLAQIYYAWGKALECATRFSEAKEKFRAATSCGVAEWTNYSRLEMDRMDQLILIEETKKKQQAQGG